jgi:hypothetical protein
VKLEQTMQSIPPGHLCLISESSFERACGHCRTAPDCRSI